MALEVLPLGGAEETSWDDPCRERGNLSHQTGRTRKIINLTSKVPWKVGGQIYLSVPRKLLLWLVWLGVAKWRLNILTIETHSTVCSQSFGPLMIWELYQAVYICIYIYIIIYIRISISCANIYQNYLVVEKPYLIQNIGLNMGIFPKFLSVKMNRQCLKLPPK